MAESLETQLGRKRKYSSISQSVEARRSRDKQRHTSRINIGEAIEEWNSIKAKHGCQTHTDVAKLLLNSFSRTHDASTPIPGTPSIPCTPGLSSISNFDQSRTLTASMVSDGHVLDVCGSPLLVQRHVNLCDTSEESPLLSDTVDVTPSFGIELTTGDEASTDNEDTTWTPSRDDIYTSDSGSELSVGFSESDNDSCSNHEDDNEILDMMTDGDVVFNIFDSDEPEPTDNETEEEVEDYILSKKVPSATSAEQVVNEEKCIAFRSCVETLAQTEVPLICPKQKCTKRVSVASAQKGSALTLTWKCESGHVVHKWSSQPYLGSKGTNAGDFLLATNILVSGNNYQKISLLFKFMNIGIISRPTFDKVQREFCFPAIENLWKTTLERTWDKLRENSSVVLAGDGRNDSPGFSAMYCTYTLVDHDSKDIVLMVNMDKRMTKGNSSNMEKEALKIGLKKLEELNLPITELVTDANSSVAAMMKHEFSGIEHQFDLWHASKNLGKKIQAISKEKGNSALAPWKKKICNHFWACSERCTTQLQLMGMWTGVLNHVVNVHEWADVLGSGETECMHGTLEDEDLREAPWLEAGSKTHEALRAFVLEKRLLNTLKYYVNFRHTGFLETFNSHLLMYASKRFSFTWPTYKARNMLAALDWQFHNNRKDKIKKNGEPVFMRRYSKHSNRWTICPVKKPKTYPHIPGLLQDIVQRRMDSTGKIPRADHKEDDPRFIARSIAPIPPPPTQSLVENHKSRFGSQH